MRFTLIEYFLYLTDNKIFGKIESIELFYFSSRLLTKL